MPQIHNQGFPHKFAKVATDLPTLGANPNDPKEKAILKEPGT
jgi:hypothetical protein